MPRLDPQQAADYLGIPLGRLKRWRNLGNGPAFLRLSHKTVVYDTAVLDAFLRSATRQPSVQAAMENRRVHLQATA